MTDDDTQAVMNTLNRAAAMIKGKDAAAAQEITPQPGTPPSLSDDETIQWLASALGISLATLGAAVKSIRLGENEVTAEADPHHDTGLLADIHHVFEIKRVSKISTVKLIEALCEVDEVAWSTYNRGKPITPRQVARQLSAYGIASKTIRLGAYKTPKGFEALQFLDAFRRYLTTPLILPPHPQQKPEANKHADLTVADKPQQEIMPRNSENPEVSQSQQWRYTRKPIQLGN